jgi:hypothetical protein
MLTKKEFNNPNKVRSRSDAKQMELPKKYGLCVHEFIHVLEKHLIISKAKTNELEMALDHVHPENITWKEFQLWF